MELKEKTYMNNITIINKNPKKKNNRKEKKYIRIDN